MNKGKKLAILLTIEESAKKKQIFDRIMAKIDDILKPLDAEEQIIFLEALNAFADNEMAKLNRTLKILNEARNEEEFD